MQKLRNARRLGYKSRILVSLRVLMTKHHHFQLSKYPLGYTRSLPLCSVYVIRHSKLLISQETNLRAGGVVAFIRNDMTFHIRNYLSLSTDEYEILWVEIVNKCNRNFLNVGIIYRHPGLNLDIFLDKIYSSIDIVNSEGKLCAL